MAKGEQPAGIKPLAMSPYSLLLALTTIPYILFSMLKPGKPDRDTANDQQLDGETLETGVPCYSPRY